MKTGDYWKKYLSETDAAGKIVVIGLTIYPPEPNGMPEATAKALLENSIDWVLEN